MTTLAHLPAALALLACLAVIAYAHATRRHIPTGWRTLTTQPVPGAMMEE